MGIRTDWICCLFVLICVGCTHASTSSSSSSGGADGLRFLAFGDWGCDCPLQYQVAASMARVANSAQTSFQIALGDNFYLSGIHGDATDHRFESTFEDVYTDQALQTPWYVIAGNHDHLGNVSAQIFRSNYSARWRYPDYFYTFTIDAADAKGPFTVQWILIDTILLDGDWPEGVEQPVGARDTVLRDLQLDWLKTTLQSSTADWIFVGGHYPVWSVGEHGPTKYLLEHVKPLLENYGVAAYFNGHDHNVQHVATQGVQYFVTGNGGMDDAYMTHEHDVPAGSLQFAHHDGGFALVNMTSASFTLTYFNTTGATLYRTSTIPNPRSKSRRGKGGAKSSKMTDDQE